MGLGHKHDLARGKALKGCDGLQWLAVGLAENRTNDSQTQTYNIPIKAILVAHA